MLVVHGPQAKFVVLHTGAPGSGHSALVVQGVQCPEWQYGYGAEHAGGHVGVDTHVALMQRLVPDGQSELCEQDIQIPLELHIGVIGGQSELVEQVEFMN